MDSADHIIEPAPGPFTCTKCGEEKPAMAFYTRKDSKAGYVRQCKACIAVTQRLRYLANRETILAKQAAHSRKHPEVDRAWYDAQDKEAMSLARHERYLRERPEVLEQKRIERLENPEKFRARRRQSYAKNSAKELATQKIWRETNPEKAQAAVRHWREEHPEYVKALLEAWRLAHPEEVKTHARSARRRRRARLHEAVTERFVDREIFERDGWMCSICHKRVNKRLKWPDPLSASIDHVTPLSKGGDDTRQNVVLAHYGCNRRKNNRSVSQQQRLF